MASLTNLEIFNGAKTAMETPANAVRTKLTAGASSPEDMMELSLLVSNYTLGWQTFATVQKENTDTLKGILQKVS